MQQTRDSRNQRRPRLIAAAAVGGSLVMLALSFASVPLYRAFCAATGFGGATQFANKGPKQAGQRVLTVRFDANVSHDLPWRFEPEVSRITLRTGQTTTIYYKATNLSDHDTAGLAAYNVSPDQAGLWFDKLACFCFSEQHLKPRESAEWPVVFYLDPALENEENMNKVEEITLSYSFFPAKGGPEKTTEAPKNGEPKT
ncbi:MAG TPA: cytochrome c oxidase assembly protein [Methylocystis sp.]|nr:cytochrome c oxidase assembly protein [Methylocystis sp.]